MPDKKGVVSVTNQSAMKFVNFSLGGGRVEGGGVVDPGDEGEYIK